MGGSVDFLLCPDDVSKVHVISMESSLPQHISGEMKDVAGEGSLTAIHSPQGMAWTQATNLGEPLCGSQN